MAAAKATADATKDLDAEKLAKFQQEVADGGGVDNKEMMNVAVVSDIGWKGGAEPAQGDDVWAQYDFKCAVSDVLEYAEYLGMDIKQDAHLLWIADEALQAPEPQGWEQRLDPKGGVYYYHPTTGMSLNQHPLDHHYQQFYLQMKAQYKPPKEPPPSPPGLTRVSGVARVHLPAGSPLTADDVAVLGRVVEQRCPIAAMLAAAGVEMDMEWVPGGAAPL